MSFSLLASKVVVVAVNTVVCDCRPPSVSLQAGLSPLSLSISLGDETAFDYLLNHGADHTAFAADKVGRGPAVTGTHTCRLSTVGIFRLSNLSNLSSLRIPNSFSF